MIWLALVACTPPAGAPCAPGFTRDEAGHCALDSTSNDTGSGTDTSADADPWLALPAECIAPGELATDPITQTDEVLPGEDGGLYEFVDIELADGVAYAVGQGGLVVLEPAPGAARVLGLGGGPRFHRVEPLGNGLVAVSHRDEGLVLFDASNPAAPTPLGSLPAEGMEGLATVDGLLYASVRELGVVVLDVSDPARPVQVGEGLGLVAPWELSKARDGYIYAADNTLGVVPIDISDPLAPVVGTAVDLGAAVLHVSVDGDHLYASVGGGGVVVMSLADPTRPTPVATLSTGGSVVMADATDGLLVAADHDGIALWDVADPTSPLPLGRQATPQFALGVSLGDDAAWVADWTAIEGWAIDRDAVAPEMSLSSRELLFASEGDEVEIDVTNHGATTLSLLGATTSDARLSVRASVVELAPGEQGALRLSFVGDGQPLDATVCLASDDPDDPVQEIRVGTGSGDPYIGLAAPDFELPGIDGVTYRLSDQLGHPVMLAYFATW